VSTVIPGRAKSDFSISELPVSRASPVLGSHITHVKSRRMALAVVPLSPRAPIHVDPIELDFPPAPESPLAASWDCERFQIQHIQAFALGVRTPRDVRLVINAMTLSYLSQFRGLRRRPRKSRRGMHLNAANLGPWSASAPKRENASGSRVTYLRRPYEFSKPARRDEYPRAQSHPKGGTKIR
jgi:hypothetical protein